jgi:putative PIN family toxin of toxin-antitoxin system
VLRVVVDTNLIISGTAASSGAAYELLEAWREGKYILVTSPQILSEIHDVFMRPKIQSTFGFTEEDAQKVIKTFSAQAYVTAGTAVIPTVSPDPDDNMFIACAIEGSASYIVTGDKHHLLPIQTYNGINIITARYFIDSCLNTNS